MHDTVAYRLSVYPCRRGTGKVSHQSVGRERINRPTASRIEISSQHSSQALLRSESHGRYLDAAGQLLPLRAEVEQAFSRIRAIDAEVAALSAEDEERARRRDFLTYQLE